MVQILVLRALLVQGFFGYGFASGVCASSSGICASSLLQTKRAVSKMDVSNIKVEVSQQQIEREKRRLDTLVESQVGTWQTFVAVMVVEGMEVEDAIALTRSIATSFLQEDWTHVNLVSNERQSTIFHHMMKPIHEVICRVKGDGSCDQDWVRFFSVAARAIPAVSAALLQAAVGLQADKVVSVNGQGTIDEDLLEIAIQMFTPALTYMVAKGEDQESAQAIVHDTFDRVLNMADSDLARNVGDSVEVIATKQAVNDANSVCLMTTESCTNSLTELVEDLIGETVGTGGIAGALLQASARPAVQLVMKIMGIPEFPEETKAERQAATKAYLAQRNVLLLSLAPPKR